MTNKDNKNFNVLSILLQFEAPFLEDGEGTEWACGTEDDDEPASRKSIFSLSEYLTRLLCSKSLPRKTDVS